MLIFIQMIILVIINTGIKISYEFYMLIQYLNAEFIYVIYNINILIYFIQNPSLPCNLLKFPKAAS